VPGSRASVVDAQAARMSQGRKSSRTASQPSLAPNQRELRPGRRVRIARDTARQASHRTRRLSRRSTAGARERCEGGPQILLSNPALFAAEVAFSTVAAFPIIEKSAGRASCFSAHVRGIGKRFVYILRSESDSTRHYVGTSEPVFRYELLFESQLQCVGAFAPAIRFEREIEAVQKT
jgi:hypothetical protein